MAIKIDLEKVYDRISWSFINDCLHEFELPVNLVQAIMACITSVSYSILWNGGKTDPFQSSRGIRQGDPISSFLFVICMDKLLQLIEDYVMKGWWNPMRAGRSGPSISHLMFANDLMLFAEASEAQITKMVECLNSFCQASGHKVNPHKTSIVFSKNVPTQLRNQITSICGYQENGEIGRYLGAYLSNGRNKKGHYKEVLCRIQNKLRGWKSHCLPLAGHITLAHSILGLTVMYNMQNDRIPTSVCAEVEKIQRSFIWGSSSSQRRMHYIS